MPKPARQCMRTILRLTSPYSKFDCSIQGKCLGCICALSLVSFSETLYVVIHAGSIFRHAVSMLYTSLDCLDQWGSVSSRWRYWSLIIAFCVFHKRCLSFFIQEKITPLKDRFMDDDVPLDRLVYK